MMKIFPEEEIIRLSQLNHKVTNSSSGGEKNASSGSGEVPRQDSQNSQEYPPVQTKIEKQSTLSLGNHNTSIN